LEVTHEVFSRGSQNAQSPQHESENIGNENKAAGEGEELEVQDIESERKESDPQQLLSDYIKGQNTQIINNHPHDVPDDGGDVPGACVLDNGKTVKADSKRISPPLWRLDIFII
jgi:hypothetical protein